MPITPTGAYRVAMNNFLASGGDGFTVFNQGTDQLGGEIDIDAARELLREELARRPGARGTASRGCRNHTSTVPPSRGITTPGTAAASSARVRKQWFSASRCTATTRHARRDLADVLDPHDDEAAFEERGAAGVDDGDARPEALDGRLDAVVPDRVAGEVELVEDESADRREGVGDRARSVLSGDAMQRQAVPVERVADRVHVEPEARSAAASSGWQKLGTSRGRSRSAVPSRWSR